MKYDKFIKLKEEFGNYGDQLAYEMCCGFTGDSRYCDHFERVGQYWHGECKLGLDPVDMKDWICPEHTLREKPKEIIEEKPKESKPNLSFWFDVDY